MTAVDRMVRGAIANGDLRRPHTCEECFAQGVRIVAHHDNYDRPLDVRWLCDSCHRSWHHANGQAPGGTEVTRRTSVLIPSGHLDKLREIAQINERTLTGEIRWLIERRIAEVSEDAAA